MELLGANFLVQLNEIGRQLIKTQLHIHLFRSTNCLLKLHNNHYPHPQTTNSIITFHPKRKTECQKEIHRFHLSHKILRISKFLSQHGNENEKDAPLCHPAAVTFLRRKTQENYFKQMYVRTVRCVLSFIPV